MSLRITGITVCVNYADLFEQSIAQWRKATDRLVVVTAPADTQTRQLARTFDAEVHVTGVFYAGGALFNKGAALTEAAAARGIPADWTLAFDADIVPGWDLREQLEELTPQPGNLHGAYRHNADGTPIGDPDIAGFFHLFHADDPGAQQRPLWDTWWTHAGNYDSTFQNRWRRAQRIRLPLHVVHLGPTWRNWCGRGNDQAMDQLLAERRRLGGFKHERMQ